jgi:hypothetical protein
MLDESQSGCQILQGIEFSSYPWMRHESHWFLLTAYHLGINLINERPSPYLPPFDE